MPRTSEHLIHDRVKFRVGQIVYAAISRDETVMGFGFPKAEREALVASDPEKVPPAQPPVGHALLPLGRGVPGRHRPRRDARAGPSRAWRMCVPKKISALIP
jgi:hypothetical protein